MEIKPFYYVWTSDGCPFAVCLCSCVRLRVRSNPRRIVLPLTPVLTDRELHASRPFPRPGDMCWGYDMANANSVGLDFEAHVNK